jgi:hypothetical protein
MYSLFLTTLQMTLAEGGLRQACILATEYESQNFIMALTEGGFQLQDGETMDEVIERTVYFNTVIHQNATKDIELVLPSAFDTEEEKAMCIADNLAVCSDVIANYNHAGKMEEMDEDDKIILLMGAAKELCGGYFPADFEEATEIVQDWYEKVIVQQMSLEDMLHEIAGESVEIKDLIEELMDYVK